MIKLIDTQRESKVLLRRITKHVKDQNWFAVGIDFIIVVIGVFIGIQVANWNDARQERLSEAQYLGRLEEELQATLLQIREERNFAINTNKMITAFADELYNRQATARTLISATEAFYSEGAFFANFRPHRTTFDDLVTTGNLGVISSSELRSQLIQLHADFADAADVINSNIEWIQQGEDVIYYSFDAFRFDARTERLFEAMPEEALAENILNSRELLRRHAAFHFWLKTRSIELYDRMEPQTQSVLDLIDSVQND